MYGQMYPEKLKTFIDEAHDAALKEWEHARPIGKDGLPKSRPKRVTSWGAIARKLYAEESPEVRSHVKIATEEHAKSVEISKEAFQPAEDDNQRLLKLQE